MKKAVITFFLLIIILVTFSYSVLYISFNLSSANNSLNSLYRKKILSNYFLKNFFRLNQVGDARYDYATDKKFTKLKIVIYYQEEETLLPKTVQKITEEIERTVKKPAGVVAEEIFIEKSVSDTVSDEELRQLIKAYPAEWSISNKTATVQIFALKKYATIPTFAGIVIDAYNIFLFMDAIRNVSDRQSSTQNGEISTILHEFAHLLGAEHVDDESCILSERVENLTDNLPSLVRTYYCQIDLDEIRSALSF